ncbi:PH domain-containing protein [Streptomyces sp. NPDC048650]|uniref:PH domain-containing protein n=1 Tax=unclassified Streptomyces TaxID=2593676 RepID=UPI00372044E1
MTSPEQSAQSPQQYADRSYRSPAALAAGVLLLLLGLWLGGDAVLRGDSRTRLTALAALLLGVPLVVAFTVRPLVRAGADRLTVRNPFRTITLPWGAVDELRAGYSAEVSTGGRKYQLWAVPVSLRQRKKVGRQPADGMPRSRFGLNADAGPVPRAMADQTLDELRAAKERAAQRESAHGEPVVRWAYPVIAPIAVGALWLLVMVAV